jgi:hypothetical protein
MAGFLIALGLLGTLCSGWFGIVAVLSDAAEQLHCGG